MSKANDIKGYKHTFNKIYLWFLQSKPQSHLQSPEGYKCTKLIDQLGNVGAEIPNCRLYIGDSLRLTKVNRCCSQDDCLSPMLWSILRTLFYRRWKRTYAEEVVVMITVYRVTLQMNAVRKWISSLT